MDTAMLVIGGILSVLQIIAILWGWMKFYTKIQVQFNDLGNRIAHIEAQYVPNGGSSLRDAINRIEAKFSKLEGRFEQHVDENDV